MTWENQSYREFFIYALSFLEPRYETKGTVMIEELEMVQEVNFIVKGNTIYGFEFNKKK
jgi:hypothetical protein